MLERELDEMVKQGIIASVDDPTDWINSLVVREKPNGSLRICLDPKDLNKAIKREHYLVPTLDMVTNRLQDATLFSHLDGQSPYWNVKLDEESSKLTTFNTHKGRFRYKKMPYGMISSQDTYQRKSIKHLRSVKVILQLQMTSRFMAMIPNMTCTCMK